MKILGHRGIVDPKHTAYQNSTHAFEIALKHCDGFETDVCLSADGHLFMLHESTTTNNTSVYSAATHLNKESAEILGDRRLDELTAAEISKLKLKNGAPIPTLNSVLALFTYHPEKTLNLELKSFNVASPLILQLYTAIKDGIIQEKQLIISSFNHPELLVVRKTFPNMAIGLLMEKPNSKRINVAPWHKENTGFYQPLSENYLQQPLFREINPNWIIFPSFALNEHTVPMIKRHHPNIKIAVWVYSEIEANPTQAARTLLENEAEIPRIDLAIIDTPHILFP